MSCAGPVKSTPRPSAPAAWWEIPAEEAARRLETDLASGLSPAEAGRRLELHGPNALPEKPKDSAAALLLRQFTGLIVWVLLAAAATAGALGEFVDAGVILGIVLLNAVVGFLQEYRAEKALESLRSLASPRSRLLRGGRSLIVDSAQIVVGDLLELAAGDRVPADGRLVRAYRLAAQEAALTGESTPVEKETAPLPGPARALGDRRNMAFLGTTVSRGKGLLLVTETGPATELGRIAALLETSDPGPTPLQVQLDRLGRFLMAAFLSITGVVFLLGLFRGHSAMEMALVSLSLAVAAIPEGLPAVVTISLALGVQKLAKRSALVRRLASVETLGCATVICSDKTGTLTKNEMTVRALSAGGRAFDVEGSGYAPEGRILESGHEVAAREEKDLSALLRAAALSSDSELVQHDGAWEVAGDPTEGALLAAAAKAGYLKPALELEMPELGELPFDSDRKLMSVLRRAPEGPRLFIKGAPGTVLERSSRWRRQGGTLELDEPRRREILEECAALARRGLRVLAVAERAFPEGAALEESAESGLEFIGVAAMMDPPRPEAREAIAVCREAGIRAVMITGDHIETALAVARELGLGETEPRALEGRDLDAMDDAALEAAVARTDVYARTSAEHKLRIVRAWKARGEAVAMTGDGVNDAPAVHEAAIGVAMGITGTDVTKEASDIVIADDNFASIVSAVEEGRGIYDNIVKAVFYLLSLNVAELLVVFAALLAAPADSDGSVFVPLAAVHILWVNLVTDGMPALALAADPAGAGIMKRPPRNASAPLVSRAFLSQVAARGVLVAAGVLAAWAWGLRYSPAEAQTMTLTALVVVELAWIQIIRASYGQRWNSNPWIVAAMLGSFAAHLAVLYVPALSAALRTAPLGPEAWGVIAAVAAFETAAGALLNRAFARPA